MFFLLALIVLVSAMLYFYFLGVWFLALIPLFFLVAGFAYVILKAPVSFSKLELSKYSLYIAWTIILSAMFGIFSFLGIDFPTSFLWMFTGNFVLLILSYIFDYNDGKKIFQFGYYFSLFGFVIVGLFMIPSNGLLSFFLMLLSLHFGFIGFLKYIIGIWTDVEDLFLYTLFVSGLLLFCILIVSGISSLPGALSIVSVVLMGLYMGLWRFVQKKPVHSGRISVRRILAGERITNKTLFSNSFLAKMYDFVVDMPQVYRYVLESINVLVIVILFVSFIVNRSTINGFGHLFYWIVVSIFVGNVLLLKKMDYTSFFQNLFLFLVINFAVYISLFSYFESNIQSIVFRSVVWNVVASLGLFVLPDKYKNLFSHKDYRYRIVASIMSFLVNVFLLLKSGLAGELIFFLLLLYVGIESMLVFYGIKYIGKKFVVED